MTARGVKCVLDGPLRNFKTRPHLISRANGLTNASLREGGGICVNFRLMMFSDKSANDGRRARYKIFQLVKRFATHSPSVIRDFRKRKYICFAGADDTSLPAGGFACTFARTRGSSSACSVRCARQGGACVWGVSARKNGSCLIKSRQLPFFLFIFSVSLTCFRSINPSL